MSGSLTDEVTTNSGATFPICFEITNKGVNPVELLPIITNSDQRWTASMHGADGLTPIEGLIQLDAGESTTVVVTVAAPVEARSNDCNTTTMNALVHTAGTIETPVAQE